MSKKLRIGVVISHPTQYFSPLFDLLTRRDNIELTVFYGNDAGARISRDEGFSVDVAWDIDLLDRYTYVMLTEGAKPSVAGRSRALARLVSGIRQLDVVVVHGYATPLAAAAIVVCKCFGVPYLLRSDTSRRDAHARLSPRAWWPRLVGSSCAGAMVVGVRNMDVQLALGVRRIFQVPFSIDVRRFAVTARSVRADARATRVGVWASGRGPGGGVRRKVHGYQTCGRLGVGQPAVAGGYAHYDDRGRPEQGASATGGERSASDVHRLSQPEPDAIRSCVRGCDRLAKCC